MLFPQLLEPCPSLPFINTPFCQSNGWCCSLQNLGLWHCSRRGRGGGGPLRVQNGCRNGGNWLGSVLPTCVTLLNDACCTPGTERHRCRITCSRSFDGPVAVTRGQPLRFHVLSAFVAMYLGCTVNTCSAVNVGRAGAKCAVNTTDFSIKCRDCQRGDSRRFGTSRT